MVTTAINTLRYARRLRDAGVPGEQAEAMADAIASELVDQLATKADLDAAVAALRSNLDAGMAALRSDLDATRAAAAADLDAAVTRIDGSLRLMQWMLGFTLAFVVALVVLMLR